MPRAKKTQSGDPAQKVQSVTGQRYGEGVAQEQMQKAMPAPNAQRSTETTMAPSNAPQRVSTPQPAPAQMQQPQVDPAQFLQQLPKNLLGQPAQGPVTAGLPFGPGSNVVRQLRTPATNIHADQLDKMFQLTGNPRYMRLRQRIKG